MSVRVLNPIAAARASFVELGQQFLVWLKIYIPIWLVGTFGLIAAIHISQSRFDAGFPSDYVLAICYAPLSAVLLICVVNKLFHDKLPDFQSKEFSRSWWMATLLFLLTSWLLVFFAALPSQITFAWWQVNKDAYHAVDELRLNLVLWSTTILFGAAAAIVSGFSLAASVLIARDARVDLALLKQFWMLNWLPAMVLCLGLGAALWGFREAWNWFVLTVLPAMEPGFGGDFAHTLRLYSVAYAKGFPTDFLREVLPAIAASLVLRA